MLGLFILTDDGAAVAAASLDEWGAWLEKADRHLDKTDLGELGWISTVFLGVDHRFVGEGPPVLWETMVFGGALDGEMERYDSVAAARAGHEEMVARVRGVQ